MRWPVRRVEAVDRTGCLIDGPDADWLVLLRHDSTRSDKPVEFTVTGAGATRVLVADLAAGRWEARRTGSPKTRQLDVAEASGAAWFEATAGAWTLKKP